MSIIKILPEYLDTFSLRLHPQVNYLSSSKQSATSLTTGSVTLAVRPSNYYKNIIDPAQKGQNSYDVNSPGVVGFDEDDYAILEDLNNINDKVRDLGQALGTGVDVKDTLQDWMSLVNSSSNIARNTKRFQIVRFDPPFSFTKNSTVKNITRTVLMPFYAAHYDMCQFGYTNYHTMNFFTGSLVPSDSAILYSNMQPAAGVGRPYSPSGSFTFDFYINPRYTNDIGIPYHAGTIMHLSSTYAISLVSGSSTDGNGSASSFKIMLQLSHSADIDPSRINTEIKNNARDYPRDLVFVSNDILKKNHWHHVSIRWGGDKINAGTGSIFIDEDVSNFSIPSSSILPPKNVASSALVFGNYLTLPASRNEAKFFNGTNGKAEGVYPYEAGFTEDPLDYSFTHPLNAEIHDVKLFDKFAYHHEIKEFAKHGRKSTDGLMLYVPPYFVKETRQRETLITPFQTETKSTKWPFNYVYSFGVGGFMINLQN
ncbi:hypothetical protein CL622_06285 [archaeon]|nr:hypothetical protein [archaeon]